MNSSPKLSQAKVTLNFNTRTYFDRFRFPVIQCNGSNFGYVDSKTPKRAEFRKYSEIPRLLEEQNSVIAESNEKFFLLRDIN